MQLTRNKNKPHNAITNIHNKLFIIQEQNSKKGTDGEGNTQNEQI
jgi:hypothetical protein